MPRRGQRRHRLLHQPRRSAPDAPPDHDSHEISYHDSHETADVAAGHGSGAGDAGTHAEASGGQDPTEADGEVHPSADRPE